MLSFSELLRVIGYSMARWTWTLSSVVAAFQGREWLAIELRIPAGLDIFDGTVLTKPESNCRVHKIKTPIRQVIIGPDCNERMRPRRQPNKELCTTTALPLGLVRSELVA